MTDRECVEFLQWALPRLEMRWRGFRKVRGQVHKRIDRRLEELDLSGIADYRDYLQAHPAEWPVLDRFCRITISRFYRDRRVFDHLRDEVLPELACGAAARGENEVRSWCVGCASGEEAYTLEILWKRHISPRCPRVKLRQVATDANGQLLRRASRARYPGSSVKDVPADWLDTVFERSENEYSLRPEFRGQVEFRQQDIRVEVSSGPFHVVLCRNLVFTYFSKELQEGILQRLVAQIAPEGVLVIGKQESLPKNTRELLTDHGLGVCRLAAWRVNHAVSERRH